MNTKHSIYHIYKAFGDGHVIYTVTQKGVSMPERRISEDAYVCKYGNIQKTWSNRR